MPKGEQRTARARHQAASVDENSKGGAVVKPRVRAGRRAKADELACFGCWAPSTTCSPEQGEGAETDPPTDIWSLGVVLYEMIAGQRPFRGDFDQSIIYSILNEPAEPLTGVRTGVPKDLERIVNKCLEKNTGERYQHVGHLLVDLQACLRGLEPRHSRVGVPVATAQADLTQALRRARRRRFGRCRA